MPSLIDTLNTLPYFQPLTSDEKADLARQISHHHFAPEQALFYEGDPATGMWIMETGRVKIYKLNPDGEEHILRFVSTGDTFAEIPALDGEPNPATAAALTQVSVWLLPMPAFQDLLAGHPRLAVHIVKLLASRVRMLVGQIENLTLYSVTVRLARFLLKQAEDPALSGPGITRASIAAHLATTPESISRSLRSLEENGAIEFDRHRILIIREDLLRIIASL